MGTSKNQGHNAIDSVQEENKGIRVGFCFTKQHL